MAKCDYRHCVSEVTHILVTYEHDIIGKGKTFCTEHAFEENRERCPCCDDYDIKFDDESGEQIELLPTYPPGTLDDEGCCSEHP